MLQTLKLKSSPFHWLSKILLSQTFCTSFLAGFHLEPRTCRHVNAPSSIHQDQRPPRFPFCSCFFSFPLLPAAFWDFHSGGETKKKSTKTLRLLEPVAPVEMFGDGSCVKMVHRWSAGTALLLRPVHDSAAFSSLKCKWGENEVDLNFRRRTSFKRWSPGCRRWAPWPRAPRSADTPHCGSQGSGRCPNHSGTEGARADRYCPPGNPPETHTNVMSGRRNTWSTTFMVPIQDGGKIC